jgi:hypothetical protein
LSVLNHWSDPRQDKFSSSIKGEKKWQITYQSTTLKTSSKHTQQGSCQFCHNGAYNKIPKVVPQNVPKQQDNLTTNNSRNSLIRQKCMKIMCKEIFKINHVNARTPRPHIQIDSVMGME